MRSSYIEDIIKSMNPFIEEFINKNKVSQTELKASFRKKSKENHPDLGGSDSAFIQLQKQYQEAKEYFEQHNEQIENDLKRKASFKLQWEDALFSYLRHYKILGLPYSMIKREDTRFIKIWQEIQFYVLLQTFRYNFQYPVGFHACVY